MQPRRGKRRGLPRRASACAPRQPEERSRGVERCALARAAPPASTAGAGEPALAGGVSAACRAGRRTVGGSHGPPAVARPGARGGSHAPPRQRGLPRGVRRAAMTHARALCIIPAR
jgi:hypothetical protein